MLHVQYVQRVEHVEMSDGGDEEAESHDQSESADNP